MMPCHHMAAMAVNGLILRESWQRNSTAFVVIKFSALLNALGSEAVCEQ